MTPRDLVIGTLLVAGGLGTMAVIAWPWAPEIRVDRALIERRWFEPAAAPKADQLKIAIAEPSLLDPGPIGPADGSMIEQAAERKLFEQQPIEKEYKRDASEREELCSRHGMHRKYFRRHHHSVWRCVKGR